tara:strand:- start:600 stop:974 length:375 start_codon:yes stop_codon:yes gene_type:complete
MRKKTRKKILSAFIYSSILLSCSSNSFTPSELFNAQHSREYVSIESILSVSQAHDIDGQTGENKIKAWNASSDVNLTMDLKSKPIAISLDPKIEKIEILSKSTNNEINYFLINLKGDKYVWIQY